MSRTRMLGAVVCAAALALSACAGQGSSGSSSTVSNDAGSSAAGETATGSAAPGTSTTPGATSTVATESPATPDGPPAEQTHMRFVKDVAKTKITPKSVQANGHGLVIANNMFYSHNVTLYDAPSLTEKAAISDSIDLAEMGYPAHPGMSKGSPVEAAWTKDGRYAYITNYTMYGHGFDGRAKDYCGPWSGYKTSYVYRLDTTTMKYDRAISVGAVPKFLLMSPNEKFVLVANWCSYTLAMVDTTTNKVVKEMPTGRNPRGLAITKDGSTAYIACEGTGDIWVADLRKGTSRLWLSPGAGPRTLILSPDGRFLYATLADADKMVKIDVARAKVVASTDVGLSPRSMDISSDGTALYSVQFDEASVAKVRTSDMKLLEKRRTTPYPIGIAYEPSTRTVWVAMYPGQLFVYKDEDPTPVTAEDIPLNPGPIVGTGSRDYGGKYPVATTVYRPPSPTESAASTTDGTTTASTTTTQGSTR